MPVWYIVTVYDGKTRTKENEIGWQLNFLPFDVIFFELLDGLIAFSLFQAAKKKKKNRPLSNVWNWTSMYHMKTDLKDKPPIYQVLKIASVWP